MKLESLAGLYVLDFKEPIICFISKPDRLKGDRGQKFRTNLGLFEPCKIIILFKQKLRPLIFESGILRASWIDSKCTEIIDYCKRAS